MFTMISFKPNEEQINFFKDAFKPSKGSEETEGSLNFMAFQDLFKLKIAKETKVGNKNCFRILNNDSEYENLISLERIKDLMREQETPEEEIVYLTKMLIPND